ncbi:MAG: HYR domain-containing protein [Verrucomicrobia bacterium]|nr:HYR domain-containing protein [Verrucomicrobiota bacterium]
MKTSFWATLVVLLLVLLPARTETPINSSIAYDPESSSNQIVLSWPAIPGQSYLIKATLTLGAPWQALNSAPLIATSNLLTYRDQASAPSRFYQIVELDTEPPQISCPANLATNTTGACGQVADFAANATDNCAVSSTVCLPASGSAFPVGTNSVTCVATDSSGNSASCSFTVTVQDLENPQLACPADVVTNTTGACGQAVSFAANATDNCAVSSTVCLPASGSAFPVGTNSVTCLATDSNGNSASCSFTVTVQDLENPQLACPADVVTRPGPVARQ